MGVHIDGYIGDNALTIEIENKKYTKMIEASREALNVAIDVAAAGINVGVIGNAVQNKIALVGNINNPETLYSKNTTEVKKEVFDCLNAGVQIIAPECAIPLKTKSENLIAITEGVSDWLSEHNKD